VAGGEGAASRRPGAGAKRQQPGGDHA
jgi:hypothetical protein